MTEDITDEKESDTLLDDSEESDTTTSSSEENPEGSDDSDGGEGQEDDVEQSKTQALKAERILRKQAQKKVKDLEAEAEQKAKDTPESKANKSRRESLETNARVALIQLQLDDPTFKERAPEGKKVLFKDHPELLLKGAKGIQMADDIAKGRLITSSEDQETKDMPNNQTTPAQAKRKEVKKSVSQKEYNNMSSDERNDYEEAEILKHAEKLKK